MTDEIEKTGSQRIGRKRNSEAVRWLIHDFENFSTEGTIAHALAHLSLSRTSLILAIDKGCPAESLVAFIVDRLNVSRYVAIQALKKFCRIEQIELEFPKTRKGRPVGAEKAEKPPAEGAPLEREGGLHLPGIGLVPRLTREIYEEAVSLGIQFGAGKVHDTLHVSGVNVGMRSAFDFIMKTISRRRAARK